MKTLSKGSMKLASAIRKSILPVASSFVVAGSFVPLDVFALPQGGQVQAGQANITQSNNQTVIHQQSSRAVIQWNSFNINTNESVTFYQPSSSSAVLNRIVDQNPSEILGNLTSNGQVFLINPNGIVFGKTARVNVAGIVASSLDITTEDFMAGQYTFTKNITNKSSEVINKGLINASSSGVILIGGNVINEGKIYAKLGNIALVSANKVSVDFDGDGLIQFEIDKKLIEKDRLPKREVINTGEIISRGGHIVLTAQTSKDVFTQVVNNEGVIKASRIENHGGDIFLLGGSQSDIINTGIIDVSGVDVNNIAGNIILQGGNIKSSGLLIADGSNKNGGNIRLEAEKEIQLSGTISTKGLGQLSKGGQVIVTGDNVSINNKAFIDASGNTGGGEILLGGDYQGKGNIKTADETKISEGVQIKADAIIDGDGGKIIVWSDKNTTFKGDISAKGGQISGDGGFVEVSGKKKLKFEGTVDTSAEQGNTGMLLLDPEFIKVAEEDGDAIAWNDNTILFDETFDESITITKEQLENLDTHVILQAIVGIEFEAFELDMQYDLTLKTRNSISESDDTKLPDKIHGIDISNAAINLDNGMLIINSGQNSDGDNDVSTIIKLGKIDVKGLEVSSANTIIVHDDIIADENIILNSDTDTGLISSGIVLDKLDSETIVTLTSNIGDISLNGWVNGQDDPDLVIDAQTGNVSIDDISEINNLIIKSDSLSLNNNLLINGNINLSAANTILLNSDVTLESTSGNIDLSQGLNNETQTLNLKSGNEIDLGASRLKSLIVSAGKLNLKGDILTNGDIDLSQATTTIIENNLIMNSNNNTILLGQNVEDINAESHILNLQGQTISLQNIGQNTFEQKNVAFKKLNLDADVVQISGNITTRNDLDFSLVTSVNINGTRELKSTQGNIDFAQTNLSGEQLTLSALNGDVSLNQVNLLKLTVYAQNARLFNDIDTKYSLDLDNATTIVLENSLSLKSQLAALSLDSDIDGQNYNLSLDADAIELGDTRVNGLSVTRENSNTQLSGDITSQTNIFFANNSTLELTQDTTLKSQGAQVLAGHINGDVALTLDSQAGSIDLHEINTDNLKVVNAGVITLHGDITTPGLIDFSDSTAIHLAKNSQINSINGDIYLASELQGGSFELNLNAENVIELGNSELGRIVASAKKLDFTGDHILTENGINFSQAGVISVAKDSSFKSTGGKINLGDIAFSNQFINIEIQAEDVELNQISDANVLASSVKVQADNLILNKNISSNGLIDFSNSNIYLNNSLFINTNNGDIDLRQTRMSGIQASLDLFSPNGKITLGKIDGIHSLYVSNQGATILTDSVSTLFDQDYRNTNQFEGGEIELDSKYGNIFINNINSDSVNVVSGENIIVQGNVNSKDIRFKARSDVSIGHLYGDNIELRSSHGSIIIQPGNGVNIKADRVLFSALNNVGSQLTPVNIDVNYLRIETAQKAVINGLFKFQQVDGDTRFILPELEFLASAKDYTLNMHDFTFIDRGLFMKGINLFSVSDDAVFLSDENEDIYSNNEMASDDLSIN